MTSRIKKSITNHVNNSRLFPILSDDQHTGKGEKQTENFMECFAKGKVKNKNPGNEECEPVLLFGHAR